MTTPRLPSWLHRTLTDIGLAALDIGPDSIPLPDATTARGFAPAQDADAADRLASLLGLQDSTELSSGDAPSAPAASSAGWSVRVAPGDAALHIGRHEDTALGAVVLQPADQVVGTAWRRTRPEDARELTLALAPGTGVAVLASTGHGLLAWRDGARVHLQRLEDRTQLDPARWIAATGWDNADLPDWLEDALRQDLQHSGPLTAAGRALRHLRPRTAAQLRMEHQRRLAGKPSTLRASLSTELASLGTAWTRAEVSEAQGQTRHLDILAARIAERGEAAPDLEPLCRGRERLACVEAALAVLVSSVEDLDLSHLDRHAVTALRGLDGRLVFEDAALADRADDLDESWWVLPARGTAA